MLGSGLQSRVACMQPSHAAITWSNHVMSTTITAFSALASRLCTGQAWATPFGTTMCTTAPTTPFTGAPTRLPAPLTLSFLGRRVCCSAQAGSEMRGCPTTWASADPLRIDLRGTWWSTLSMSVTIPAHSTRVAKKAPRTSIETTRSLATHSVTCECDPRTTMAVACSSVATRSSQRSTSTRPNLDGP